MEEVQVRKEALIELIRFVEERSVSLAEQIVEKAAPGALEAYRARVPLEDLFA